jgi:hypothetical protein
VIMVRACPLWRLFRPARFFAVVASLSRGLPLTEKRRRNRLVRMNKACILRVVLD